MKTTRGRAWAADEIQILRENYGKIPTASLAAQLGRTVKAVCSRAKLLSIRTRRLLTSEQIDAIRDAHGKETARQTAARLGVNVWTVHNARHRMGLGRGTRLFHGDEFAEFIKTKHALGWSDTEIASAYSSRVGRKVDRHSVGRWRLKLGLPDVGWSEHRRQNVARKTQAQLKAAGLPSIGYLRVEAFKKFARESGWPEDLQKRETQILNLMWERGPMTKRELVTALGMPWKGSRKSLCGNRKGGSYLATLMRRGMVICLGRLARHPDCGKGNRAGQGKNACIYSLSPTIERRIVPKKNQSETGEKDHEQRLHHTVEAAGDTTCAINHREHRASPLKSCLSHQLKEELQNQGE